MPRPLWDIVVPLRRHHLGLSRGDLPILDLSSRPRITQTSNPVVPALTPALPGWVPPADDCNRWRNGGRKSTITLPLELRARAEALLRRRGAEETSAFCQVLGDVLAEQRHPVDGEQLEERLPRNACERCGDE